MYSPDRLEQFKIALACLKEVDGYNDCQKILLVDGNPNIFPENFEIYEVKRPRDRFNWAAMWNAGVEYSKGDICWYLDSDRIVPKNYLDFVVEDDAFYYTSNLFQFTKNFSLQYIKMFREINVKDIKRFYHRYKRFLFYDTRYSLPLTSPGKNVMSGNVIFKKEAYIKSGGVDPWYEGHGAFADTDFTTQCYNLGFKFVNNYALELHLNHEKVEGNSLSFKELGILGLNNMVRYCKKWGFSLNQAVEYAGFLDLFNPEGFIKTISSRIDRGVYEPLVREVSTAL